MTTKYHWQKTISNVYLGKTKVIRGLTRADVNQRAAVQLNQWAQQEAQQKAKLRDQLNKQAQQDYLLALQEQAEQDTNAAQQRLSALQELLRGGLHQHAHFTWNSLKQLTPYPAFHFNEPPPTLEYFKEHMGVPAVRSSGKVCFPAKKQNAKS
jgi:restriction system protein